MCNDCGCDAGEPTLTVVDHHHHHDHDHPHDHSHETVTIEKALLAHNELHAADNRAWLAERGVLALNLVSSPGAGKTTLLERTARELGDELGLHVIEGDQETASDAERIRAAGCKAVQINTGLGCHLDAAMVRRALEALDPPRGSVVLIENVGNLVCPALFDLGERAKVVVASTTEGEDKPLKYPHMFRASQVLILNKIDLLPHLEFDVERCLGYAKAAQPDLQVLKLSARTGDGLEDWYGFLRSTREAALAEGAL